MVPECVARQDSATRRVARRTFRLSRLPATTIQNQLAENLLLVTSQRSVDHESYGIRTSDAVPDEGATRATLARVLSFEEEIFLSI